MDDRLRVGKQTWYVISHPGQLSFLSLPGRETSTSQSSAMLCGWGINAGWLIPFVDKRVGGR